MGGREEPEAAGDRSGGRRGKRRGLVDWFVFRLTVKEPPTAGVVTKDEKTGLATVYRSVDERCAACVVYGGHEERCVGEAWDKAIGEPLGKVCPRSDLEPDLTAEAELLGWLIHDDKRVLAEARFWTLANGWGLSPTEAGLLLERVSHVLSDDTVISLLHPEPDTPERSEPER